MQAEPARIGHTLRPLEIMVVDSRAGSRCGHRDCASAGCDTGCDATRWLLAQGARLTGTDGWRWDAPFVHTTKTYAESGDAGLIRADHRAGRDIGRCRIEARHKLASLPGDGFSISGFPHQIRSAAAGWTRAVAPPTGSVG